MRYINIETDEYPLSEETIKRRYPNTSFPVPFTPPAGYKPVVSVPRPPMRVGMVTIEGPPYQDGDTWYQAWSYVEQTAIQRARSHESQWRAIRIKRNDLLAKTDWIASVVDSPMSVDMKEKWLTYRQELRDITNASDPTQVVWPSEPTADSIA